MLADVAEATAKASPATGKRRRRRERRDEPSGRRCVASIARIHRVDCADTDATNTDEARRVARGRRRRRRDLVMARQTFRGATAKADRDETDGEARRRRASETSASAPSAARARRRSRRTRTPERSPTRVDRCKNRGGAYSSGGSARAICPSSKPPGIGRRRDVRGGGAPRNGPPGRASLLATSVFSTSLSLLSLFPVIFGPVRRRTWTRFRRVARRANLCGSALLPASRDTVRARRGEQSARRIKDFF